MNLIRVFQKSFSARLSFAYLTIFTLVFIITGGFLADQLGKQTLLRLEESLGLKNHILATAVSPYLEGPVDERALHEFVVNLGRNSDLRVTLIDPQGRVLGDSDRSLEELLRMDNHRNRPEIQTALQQGVGASRRYSNTVKQDLLYVASLLKREGEVSGVIRTAVPLMQVNRTLAAVKRPVIMGSAVGILIVLIVCFVLGQYVAKRVREMTEAARRYAEGDFEEKIHVNAEDELRVLADSMNHMVSNLKDRITEIENQRATASAILENMTEGVISVNASKEIVTVNTSADKILRTNGRSVIGRNLIEVFRNPRLDEIAQSAINEQKMISDEIELTKPEGKVLRVNAVGFGTQENAIAGILVLHDVTEVRRLEKVRRDFVANVSHELKTPLTSIKGFIETLLGGALKDSEQSKTFLMMMEEDTNRLSRLIHDLLELSQIESKEVPLRSEKIDLLKEIKNVVAKLEPSAKEKKISIRITEGPKTIPEVIGDRDKLKQVLVNLLDNAIKFNKENGQVDIHLEPGADRLKVTFQDTGSGIPEEAIPRIFERFYRVDKARSSDLGGTGLGLAIVKHIVEAHGGRVSCQSVLGEGSVISFTLKLPLLN